MNSCHFFPSENDKKKSVNVLRRHIISSNFKSRLVKSAVVGPIRIGLTVQSSSKRCPQLSMYPRPSAQWLPNVSCYQNHLCCSSKGIY